MMDQIKDSLMFQSQALQMRSRRQEVISSNISNADTPGYKAVDVNFKEALSEATGKKIPRDNGVFDQPRLKMSGGNEASMIRTDVAHLVGRPHDNTEFSRNMQFRRGDTPALDGNSVNIERERAAFAENTIKYEASLRALNGRIKTLKEAMKD